MLKAWSRAFIAYDRGAAELAVHGAFQIDDRRDHYTAKLSEGLDAGSPELAENRIIILRSRREKSSMLIPLVQKIL